MTGARGIRSPRWPEHPTRVVGVIVLAVSVMTACGTTSASSDASPRRPGSSTSRPATSALRGTLTVAAAASLTEVFGVLGRRFEAAHPGVEVDFSFGSSGILEDQLAHGAPADVFASADARVMAEARRAGTVDGEPTVFARNTLELVVRPGNPLGVRSLEDLERADVVALCARRAPCGASAEQVLATAGVDLPTSKVTRGQDVKATLRQVTAGDADAAIVYVTDARTVGSRATAVPIPAAQDVVTSYPMAVVHTTSHRALARAWITFVAGPVGQRELRDAGFRPPG